MPNPNKYAEAAKAKAEKPVVASETPEVSDTPDAPVEETNTSEEEAKVTAEADAKAIADRKAKLKEDARAKAKKAQLDAQTKAQAEAKAKIEAEAKKAEEVRAKEIAEARAEAKAEAKAEFEAEAKAKAEVEVKDKVQTPEEADVELKALEEEDAKKEVELKALQEAEKEVEPEPVTLLGTVRAVGEVLAESPDSLTIERVHEDKKYFYRWIEANSDARREIAALLHNMWQNSSDSFNYESLAKRLRVKVIDIQGVLDADFIEDNNLEDYAPKRELI